MDDKDGSSVGRSIASASLALLIVCSAGMGGIVMSSQPASATHDCNGVDMFLASTAAGADVMVDYGVPYTSSYSGSETFNEDKCGRNHVSHVVESMEQSDAQQEHIDIYKGLVSAQESSDPFRTTTENTLTDLEADLLMKGQAAAMTEYQETGSLSAANTAGVSAILDVVSARQKNQIGASNTQVLDMKQMRQTAVSESELTPEDVLTGYMHGFDTSTEAYQNLDTAGASGQTWSLDIYDTAGYSAPPELTSEYLSNNAEATRDKWDKSFVERDVILANNSRVTAHVPVSADYRSGCSCDYDNLWSPVPADMFVSEIQDGEYANVVQPSMQGVSTDGDDSVDAWELRSENHVIYAESPSNSYTDKVAYNPDQYARLFLQTQLSGERMVDNLNKWMDSVGPALESGQITADEALPALTVASQYTGDYEESNHAIYAVAMLADAGMATPELGNTGSMTVQFGGAERTGYVVLGGSSNMSSLAVGQTYNAGDIDGEVYFIGADGTKTTINGDFTLTDARNKNGDSVDSVSYKQYAYETVSTEDFEALLNDMNSLRDGVEDREPTTGGTTATPGDSGPDPVVIAGGAMLAGAVVVVMMQRSPRR